MQICQIKLGVILKAITPAILSTAVVFAVGLGISHALVVSEQHFHWPGKLWMVRLAQLAIGGGVTATVAISLMMVVEPSVREFLLGRLKKKKGKVRIVEEAPALDIEELQKPTSESVA